MRTIEKNDKFNVNNNKQFSEDVKTHECHEF